MSCEIVGDLTVSTVGKDRPTREWQRIGDLFHWIYATRRQVGYVRQAVHACLPYRIEARRLNRERDNILSAHQQHMFLVAAGSLHTAIRRSGKQTLPFRPSRETMAALKVLRDVYEHWTEHRNSLRPASNATPMKAAAKLRADYPDAQPWSISIRPSGDLPIANSVSLAQLDSELRTLEAGTLWERRRLRRIGKHRPVSDAQPNNKLQQTGDKPPAPP